MMATAQRATKSFDGVTGDEVNDDSDGTTGYDDDDDNDVRRH